MALLNEDQKRVLDKALALYRTATTPTEPYWLSVLLAMTKAQQKTTIEPYLIQVKNANTSMINTIDAKTAAVKLELSAENTTIDQLIASF